MSVYINLSHGRKTPEEALDNWGSEGPLLGPFDWVHVTYLCNLRAGGDPYQSDDAEFEIVEDLIYYDGVYYGDWDVLSTGDDLASITGFKEPQGWSRKKATLPMKRKKGTEQKKPGMEVLVKETYFRKLDLGEKDD